MNNEDYIINSSTPTTVATSPDCDEYFVLCQSPMHHQQQQQQQQQQLQLQLQLPPCYCLVTSSGPASPENSSCNAIWCPTSPPYHTMTSPSMVSLPSPSAAAAAAAAAAAVSTMGISAAASMNNNAVPTECDCCLPTTSADFKPSFYNPFEVKHRRRTSRAQFKVLERTFEETPKPNAQKRRALAQKLGMTPRGVQVWFQNRRAKAKAQLRRDQQQKQQQQQQEQHQDHPEKEDEEEDHQRGMVEDAMHRLVSAVTAPLPHLPALGLSSIEPITPPFPMDPFWVDESCKSTLPQRQSNDWEDGCCWVTMDAMADATTTAFDTLFPPQPQINHGPYINHANELRRSASFPHLVAPMGAFNEDQRRLSEPIFNSSDLDLALLNCIPSYYGAYA